MTEQVNTPQHIAIIMDGNRRWARQNKLEAFKGHEYVAHKIIEELTEAAMQHGIKYLTLWAFSTENWKREEAEVQGLMHLFRESFKKNAETLHKKGVKLNVIGDISRFPEDIQENIAKWLDLSKDNQNITVTFALNYGGRDEITRAFNRLLESLVSGSLDQSATDKTDNLETDGTLHKESLFPSQPTITEAQISSCLDTKDMPDPDLIIRPGGEKRLSGYLPWQSVYSELYFTETLMPDFGASELQKALDDYALRQRRFGR